MGASVPGRLPVTLGVTGDEECEFAGDRALQRPHGREWAILGTFGAAHQRAHRYLPTSLHSRKQPLLWCRTGHPRSERRGGAPSRYVRSALSRQAHSDAAPREHLHQGVDTEAMEAPPHKIVQARLAYSPPGLA